MPYQRTILLGVVGDSAAGKTTLSSGIANILGPERTIVICADDYHRYNRRQRKERGITALNPACNYIDIMEQHLDLLRRGHPILKPVYNHNTGDFDPPEYIEPREFIIVEGLLGFHSRALRRNYDVKVYLAPEEELRIRWKLKRDTSKRGYTPAEVREALTKRGDDSPKFIQPQQTHADIIVNFHRPAHQAEETGAHLDVRLILRPTLPHPNLGELIECDENLKNPIVCVSIDRQGDWLVENVDISGRISDEKSAQIEALIWRRLTERYPSLDGLRPEQVGSFQDGAVINQSHPLALTQLLIAYHTLIARQDLDEELRKLAQR